MGCAWNVHCSGKAAHREGQVRRSRPFRCTLLSQTISQGTVVNTTSFPPRYMTANRSGRVDGGASRGLRPSAFNPRSRVCPLAIAIQSAILTAGTHQSQTCLSLQHTSRAAVRFHILEQGHRHWAGTVWCPLCQLLRLLKGYTRTLQHWMCPLQ